MFRSGLPLQSPTDASAPAVDGRPLIVPAPSVTPLPVADVAAAARSVRHRLRAASLHLALSALAGIGVLALVLLAWYPEPMTRLHSVRTIVVIMVAVDVFIGPLLTFLLFDPRKSRLALDLAAVVTLQLLALFYGLHTVHQGRPAFVVLVEDRFEVVSPAELKPEIRARARHNPESLVDPLLPRWVALRLPAAQADREALVLDGLEKGEDLQHHAERYVPLLEAADTATAAALPIARLRALNPSRSAEIDAALERAGLAEDAVRYLPLRGPARDGAVLLSARDATVLEVLVLRPW